MLLAPLVGHAHLIAAGRQVDHQDRPAQGLVEDDLPRLHAEATAIRARLREGALKPAATESSMEDVDIEQQHTETFMVTPSAEPRPAERAEQKLVLSYRDYMTAKGIRVRRKRYWPAGEVRPIYSDVWVEDRRAIIEAKNSDSRDALRQAIGQLYDYRRFHQPPVRLAVLLPYRLNSERLDLLRSADIEAIWPYRSKFHDSAGGVFVLEVPCVAAVEQIHLHYDPADASLRRDLMKSSGYPIMSRWAELAPQTSPHRRRWGVSQRICPRPLSHGSC